MTTILDKTRFIYYAAPKGKRQQGLEPGDDRLIQEMVILDEVCMIFYQ